MITNRTFYKWIKDQDQRNDLVGDCARDVVRDKFGICKVSKGNNYKWWLKYYKQMQACDGALEALLEAWKEYDSELEAVLIS